MHLISVDEAKPGQLVGRALMDPSGRVLLQEGVELNEAYIEALRAKGYTRLYVRDPGDAVDIEIEEDVSPAVRVIAYQTLRDAYTSIEKEVSLLRAHFAKDITEVFNSDSVRVLLSDKGYLTKIISVVNRIIENVLSHATLAGLTSIKSADTKAYDHSIDVCVISIMIGAATGMENARLRQLAAGSLLHDIGKIFLEPHVQGKARIIQHAKLGYELLKNAENPDIMAPYVAYEHHEHQDGSGQPRGLRGSNSLKRDRGLPPPIPTLVGEIAAVANIYDNLLSGSDRHEPMTPDAAVKIIRDAAGAIFNKEVVATFLRLVPIYPQGTEVIVRSGKYRNFVGVVAKVNPAALDRPIIILTQDSHGKKMPPEEVNLADLPDTEVRGKGI